MQDLIIYLKYLLKVKKAIELNNSGLFDVHTWSEYPEVNNAVNHIYAELQVTGRESVRKKHVKVLILDLYVKWLKDPTMYSSVYMAKWYYDGLDSRYNKIHISKLTRILVPALEAAGYLVFELGNYNRDNQGHTSHTTRMRATPKLIDLINSHEITPEMVERYPSIETILLRDILISETTSRKTKKKILNSKRISVPYDDSDDARIQAWREGAVAYNNLLRRTYIDVPSAPVDGIPCRQGERSKRRGNKPRKIKVNQHDKFVHRVFNNNSWDDGGRFYGGWWQRISEEWRSEIRIWNNPVTEIDFKGLHIGLLYRLKGIPYDADPYHLRGYPEYEGSKDMRMLLKQVLLCAINAESKTKAIQAVNKEVNFNPEKYSWVREDELNLGELIDALAAEHALLAEDFFSGRGIELQNIDSLIAEKVINHFTAQDIVVLCVHDSFVIPAFKAEELKQVMEAAYIEVFQETGIDSSLAPKVDLTGLELGQWDVIMSHPDWRELRESFIRETHDYPEWAERLRKFRARTEMANYNTNYYVAENESQ